MLLARSPKLSWDVGSCTMLCCTIADSKKVRIYCLPSLSGERRVIDFFVKINIHISSHIFAYLRPNPSP